MIAALKGALRPFYHTKVKGTLNYVYDARRFFGTYNRHRTIAEMTREQAATHLLRTMHSLEKGLALPTPKPGFGHAKAVTLQKQADAYQAIHGTDEIYRDCMAVLADWSAYQANNGSVFDGFSPDALRQQSQGAEAGYRTATRDEIWQAARIDFPAFARSRSSVRMFAGDPVPEADLLAAIEIAGKSPSVCNRACGRAYYTTDPTTMARMLAHQNGNRGFGDKAGAVLLVAADMSAFYQVSERNQGWIDGGLFAMSLNYALHAQGYGVCMLNWSMNADQDRRLREDFAIPDTHLVIMMMAVGTLPDELRLAVSPRRHVSEYAFSR